MHKDEFKRRLRKLVRQELLCMDLEALIHQALESMEDFQTIVHEAVQEQYHMTNSAGPDNQQRVLH